MKPLILAALSLALMGQAAPPVAKPAAAAPDVALWRLDCGTLLSADFGEFSDIHAYDGRSHELTDSCYLIKHGSDYLLWDTGLPGDLEGKSVTTDGFTLSVRRLVVGQLAQIGVKPEQVRFVGISHYHDDHTGQARDFPGATLLIGKQDFETIKSRPETAKGFAAWIDGGSKVDAVGSDRDVFGDGSVMMLAMPGHTAGHHALLVRLKGRGAILLSGDLYHARESLERGMVPAFNADRADTLASFDRFKGIADTYKATVIVQHEPKDIGLLPTFPEAAR